MYSHGDKTYQRDNLETSTRLATEADRRRANRHLFTAAADVVELSSGARFSTRTTDLGPGGCFVDTLTPFLVGSKVHVSIRKGKTELESCGTVVYSQAGIGMGIAFDELDPDERIVLDTWMSGFTGETQQSPEPERLETGFSSAQHPNGPALARLVQLLIKKGTLTNAEAATVLDDSVLF